MARKRGKSISFDGMVKFFMKNYNIPMKKDIVKIEARLDRIEKLLKKLIQVSEQNQTGNPNAYSAGKKLDNGSALTASDTVLGIVKRSKKGIDFSGLQVKTGFNDKKLRNIIFRLNKIGRIKRKARGIYVIA